VDFCLNALVICRDDLTSVLNADLRVCEIAESVEGLAEKVTLVLSRVREDLRLIRGYRPPGTTAALELFDRLEGFVRMVEEIVAPASGHSGETIFELLKRRRNDCPLPEGIDREKILDSVPFRAVASVDLIEYSDIVRQINPEAGDALRTLLVGGLNSQIESLMTETADPNAAVLSVQGDGALLAFADPESAHEYAIRLHESVSNYNEGSDEPSRFFRVGMSWGRIFFHTNRDPTGTVNRISTGGYAIVAAVRLQANAEPGGTLVEVGLHAVLSDRSQAQYDSVPRNVPGKRGETFTAYDLRSR